MSRRVIYISDRVIVPAPLAGAEIVLELSGREIEFGFDLATVIFERAGDSLVLRLDDGGSVTLSDFFAASGDALPDLVLENGIVVAGDEYLAQFDLDISTAAGPAASGPPPGGGIGVYDDDAGSLVGGVGRLQSREGDDLSRPAPGEIQDRSVQEPDPTETAVPGEIAAYASDITVASDVITGGAPSVTSFGVRDTFAAMELRIDASISREFFDLFGQSDPDLALDRMLGSDLVAASRSAAVFDPAAPGTDVPDAEMAVSHDAFAVAAYDPGHSADQQLLEFMLSGNCQ